MIAQRLAEYFLSRSLWRERPWYDVDLDGVFERFGQSAELVLVELRNGDAELRAPFDSHAYLPSVEALFRAVADAFGLTGRLLVSFRDGVPGELNGVVPIFGFSKLTSDASALLLPDPYFLDNVGYHDNGEVIDRILASTPRERREKKAYWRGSSTGIPAVTRERWRENPRVRLCQLARANPEVLDARLARFVQGDDPGVKAALEAEGLFGPWEPLERNMEFLYGIDIDGNTCAWGLLQKLRMDLAIVKVRSPSEQWFTPELEAGTHYLPTEADLSDLVSLVASLRDDEARADSLAKNARAFARSLGYAEAIAYTGLLAAALCRPGETSA